MGRLWWVIKQWFTKLIKPHKLYGIICKFVQILFCLLGAQFFELQVQFRCLLPQLGVPQLLEDVIGKDTNE